MGLKYDAVSEEYKGVLVNRSVTPNPFGPPSVKFTYLIVVGAMTIQISEKTAVDLSEDLINTVSQANDPTSPLNRRFAESVEQNPDGTYTFNG